MAFSKKRDRGPISGDQLNDVCPDKGSANLRSEEGASLPAPVLSFNARKLRVQVTFTAVHASCSEVPPESLYTRAKAKMDEAKAKGEVAFYMTFRNRLETAWTRLREETLNGRVAVESVTLTLAAGAPDLPGLVVRPGSQPNVLVTLKLEVSDEVARRWRLDWVLLHVRKALRDGLGQGAIDSAQVHGALARARAGIPAQEVEITPRKRRRPCRPGQGFGLSVNQGRREVYLEPVRR